MRAMLVGGTQVATYDQFKQLYGTLGLSGLANQFSSSMSAGLIYSIITMPFETAKNRMAFQTPDPATGKLPFTGTMQTIGAAARSSINRSTSSRPSMISFLGAVARSSGPLSLWSGFLPYYGRCEQRLFHTSSCEQVGLLALLWPLRRPHRHDVCLCGRAAAVNSVSSHLIAVNRFVFVDQLRILYRQMQ